MNDTERRMMIEAYAATLDNLRQETMPGYGLLPKDKIVERIERMLTLAKELEQ